MLNFGLIVILQHHIGNVYEFRLVKEGQTTTVRITDEDPNGYSTPMSCGASNWNVIP